MYQTIEKFGKQKLSRHVSTVILSNRLVLSQLENSKLPQKCLFKFDIKFKHSGPSSVISNSITKSISVYFCIRFDSYKSLGTRSEPGPRQPGQ